MIFERRHPLVVIQNMIGNFDRNQINTYIKMIGLVIRITKIVLYSISLLNCVMT